jgi:hypothetical protein
MSSASSRMAPSWQVSTGATCSWLSPGLSSLRAWVVSGKGVGDGLVPVHVGAAGVEFSPVVGR